jgi:thiamine kinase-like enzyme
MDHLHNLHYDSFIHDKSLETFKSLNQLEILKEEVEIQKCRLSGNSNTIYRVEIGYLQDKNNQNAESTSNTKSESCSEIKIKKIFFKIFGPISVLVDRELETYIMQKLYELGVSPKIYDTDMKTYRIEEYIDNCICLERDSMLDKEVYQKVIKLFCSLTALGDFKFYFNYIGNSNKSVFYEKLKNDTNTNFVNFSLNKMKPLGLKKFLDFKEKYFSDEKHLRPSHIDEKNLEKMDFALNNLEKLIYDVCPEKGIMVINHNDAHPLNILRDQERKIFLCDFEYSTYNLLGFDISNYLVESLFLLEADSFPFYHNYSKTNCSELKEEKFYQIYISFLDTFEKENKLVFSDLKEYSSIIEMCRTREYYYRLIGISSLFWFSFATIYLDYDSSKIKDKFDYFNFSVERLNIYDEFVRKNIDL